MNKKILFINDFKIGGGAEEVVSQTIEILQTSYQVKTFFGSTEALRPKSLQEYIYSRFFYTKLKNILNSYKPDVIFIANYYHLLSPSILQAIKEYKKDLNVKVVMTTHDFHLLCPNSGFRYFSWISEKFYNFKKIPSIVDILTKKYDNRGLLYSVAKQLQWFIAYKILRLDGVIDTFISPSKFLASLLKEKYKSVHLIRNPMPSLTSNKLNIHKQNPDKLNLVFIGRVSQEKGLYPFIKSLKHIDFNYSLTIIGDGDFLSEMKKVVELEHLSDKIKFKNKMTRGQVLQELELYDILVLPSLWYENAPLSLVEASLKGLGIITMDYGGMKEIAEICGNYYLLKENYSNILEAFHFFQKFQRVDNSGNLIKIFSTETYQKNIIEIIEGLR